MKTIEYHDKVDKSKWPKGEWDNEPDKKQWRDTATGLPCLAVRSNGGNWCGYVGVSSSHTAYEKDYDDVAVNVHGGLTFAGHCTGKRICHVVEADEDDNVWWLGFDCGHYNDLRPIEFVILPQHLWQTDTIYRNLAYVEQECMQLAKQLSEM